MHITIVTFFLCARLWPVMNIAVRNLLFQDELFQDENELTSQGAVMPPLVSLQLSCSIHFENNGSAVDPGTFHFHQLVDAERGVGMRGKQSAHATGGKRVDREHMSCRPLRRF